ncbi:class I SAM-dependent methyltransferase [Paraburkholderia sp. BR13439]|uniref:class I SAM-dependent methyltransferase n=1 Tax=Paraburkholderia sp. BR13439 TaxID=3236996 RepID=UPI0034CF29F3
MDYASMLQPHNAEAAGTWGSAGRQYERVSQSISDAIEHCVIRVAPQPGERVLDVATGTGWAARRIAARGASGIGIDLAANLIETAKAYAADAQLSFEFQVGDAEALQFEDQSFDAVISTFGVMFASDPDAAASELARVCKPGGRLGIASWRSDGTVAGLFKIMQPYVTRPPVPLPTSPFAWGNTDYVKKLLGAAFDLRFESGTTVLRELNGSIVWELSVESYGPIKTLAASLDPDSRERLRQDFITYHEGFQSELGIAMPREYLVAIGIRK